MSLKYILDHCSIEKDKLKYLGNDPKEATHRVLVIGNGLDLHGYAAPTGHVRIAKNYGLNKLNVLGGFSFYLNKDEILIFNGRSSFYGGVPKKVAGQFAKLIERELKKKGVRSKKIIVDPIVELNPRWGQYGFYEEGLEKLVSRR